MTKNFNYLIIFILTILLTIIVLLLVAANPFSQKDVKGTIVSVTDKNINFGMGLYYSQVDGYIDPLLNNFGMGLYYPQDHGYVDTLLANGFNDLRIDIPDYQNIAWLKSSKAAVIRAIAKGAKVVWGVSSNNFNNSSHTITSSNWTAFRQAILDNAKWAQDNGVYEFQLGNEEEYHVDGTTMTVAKLIINLKSVATDVQSIFTRGEISYSCAHTNIYTWISAGKGDIDILASNVYMGYGNIKGDLWKTEIDSLVNSFGVNGTYLTEFSLNSEGLAEYSTNEVDQATGLVKMLDYIEASGITRAFWYTWKNDTFGALKNDGTYRLLWNILTAYSNR